MGREVYKMYFDRLQSDSFSDEALENNKYGNFWKIIFQKTILKRVYPYQGHLDLLTIFQ